MSLKNIKNQGCGSVTRNLGILKTDQIELVSKTSAPSDSDLANARIYYDSTDATFKGRSGSAWWPFGGSYLKLNVVHATSSTTLTAAQSGSLVYRDISSVDSSVIITLPSAATSGLYYYIANLSSTASTGNLCIACDTAQQWIGGTSGSTRILNAQYESMVLIADGSTTYIRISGAS